MNATNMRTVYDATRKMLTGFYFGAKKNPKDPFKNCKTNRDLYNVSRKIKSEQNSFLNRFIVIIDYTGEIRNSGFEVKLKSLKEIIENFKESQVEEDPLGDTTSPKDSDSQNENIDFEKERLGLKDNEITVKPSKKGFEDNIGTDTSLEKYYKHDYGVCFTRLLSILAHDNIEKNGIIIFALMNKRVYPYSNVWPPTQQNLYSLFNEYILEKGHIFKTSENMLDMGCGTGILSIIFNKNLEFKNKTYAFDINKNAVKSTNVNRQIFEIYEKFHTQCFDLNYLVDQNITS